MRNLVCHIRGGIYTAGRTENDAEKIFVHEGRSNMRLEKLKCEQLHDLNFSSKILLDFSK